MARLSEDEKKEYQKVMADPQAGSKFRLVIGGMLDEFDEKAAADAAAKAKDKPKSFFEELDDVLFGRKG